MQNIAKRVHQIFIAITAGENYYAKLHGSDFGPKIQRGGFFTAESQRNNKSVFPKRNCLLLRRRKMVMFFEVKSQPSLDSSLRLCG
jgi:hypothetical protein